MPAAKTPAKKTAVRERRQRVQSAEMGINVLKALAQLGGAASLTAVANLLEESTAKAHRYMVSLVDSGLVEQDPATQRYLLGQGAIHIGLAAMRQCDPLRAGELSLVRLRDSLGVTSFISVMGNLGPTILRIEEPTLPVSINVRAGSVMPLLWSATGQVFLAYADDAVLLKRAREEWRAGTKEQKRAFSDTDPVNKLGGVVREIGCAEVRDLMLRGISAVAAPILDHRGRIVAVLTALGASGGFDPAAGGPVGTQVREEALRISRALGYTAA